MSGASLHTTWLHEHIERLRAGDRQAQEELIGAIGARMRRLAQRMLQNYPGVRAAADTDDVFQNALLRLLAALRKVRPESTHDFFRLAAYLTRQELIDLLRRCRTRAPGQPLAGDAAIADPRPSPEHLDAWLRFHQAIEELAAEQRDVVGLAFYHGWTQAQIGALLGVDVRTVRRRWAASCLRLREVLAGDLDELLGA